LFTFGGTTELVAHSLSVSAAVLFSFTLNARHNFKTTDHTALRFVSFVIVCLIGFLVGYGIIMLVSAGMADPIRGGNIGKLVSLPVVFILQYVLNSRITFRSGQAS
jgi:putative flippase GtrA